MGHGFCSIDIVTASERCQPLGRFVGAIFLDYPVTYTIDTDSPGAVELYFQSNWGDKNVEATPIVERPFGAIFSIDSPDGHLLTVVSQR